MQLEERIDQIKNFWWVVCFTPPNFNVDLVHVIFVLLINILIQLYLEATHHEVLVPQDDWDVKTGGAISQGCHPCLCEILCGL